jgi:DNA mismatch repair protein MutL
MISNRENWEQLYSKNDFRSSDEKSQKQPVESNSIHQESGLHDITPAESNFYQVHGRFILSQVKSGILIIDQQKAHERILFEKYARLLERRDNLSQQELYPVRISLSPEDAEIMGEIKDELNLLGFRIVPDEKGNFRFIVNGTPAGMKQSNIEDLIEGIIENYKAGLINLHLDKRINLARSMAKKTSIKYGKTLHQPEMKLMFDQLFACRVPEVSIDGDSVIQMITLNDLVKLFSGKNEQNI